MIEADENQVKLKEFTAWWYLKYMVSCIYGHGIYW
jgi:hypothetical protein